MISAAKDAYLCASPPHNPVFGNAAAAEMSGSIAISGFYQAMV